MAKDGFHEASSSRSGLAAAPSGGRAVSSAVSSRKMSSRLARVAAMWRRGLGAAEGEEQSPAQVFRGLVGFQGDGAGSVLPGVDVQVEDVVQGGQDAADLLCPSLGHQLYGSPR